MSRARIWTARFLCCSLRVSQGQVSSRRRSKRLRFFSRTGALLGGRENSDLAGEGSEAAEESIDDSSCVQQVFQRAEGCCRSWRREGLYGRGEVGPIGGNQRFTAIRQDQYEKEPTSPVHRPENVERFAFERMPRSDNGDLFRKVLMMGSVSCIPLMRSITISCSRW